MPAIDCYLDTSALLKLYVAEAFSGEVEAFVGRLERPAISRLTTLEWHCAMLRRLRTGAFSREYLALAQREFLRHQNEGYFHVSPIADGLYNQAIELLEAAKPHPLRSLDALHLATARALRVNVFATADKVLANAAQALGMQTQCFFL